MSAGPGRAASTIREALAKGADRGILVEDDRFSDADSLTTARALAAALGKEDCDLILTGLQSDDAGFGQTGVVLAELLGLPHATIIKEIKVAGELVRVKRELEAGWFQQVEMAAARIVDDPVGCQPGALRNADGHQESEIQTAATIHGRRAWRRSDAGAFGAAALRAEEVQANADARRLAQRSGRAAR